MNQDRAFSFVPMNKRADKPRGKGITEIRGPYYSVMGQRYLSDVLETMGYYVDGLKFAGGSFALMPEKQVRTLIDLAHEHGVYVSTGGWIERVLMYGPEMVNRYIKECGDLGFDMVEISTGFITLPVDDLLRLVERVVKAGMKAKPELGIQFGAGGATQTKELEAEGTRDVGWLISQAKRCLNAGATIIMIESEGITESVREWRTDVITRIVDGIGLERAMFEAADPEVFQWYVKNYGTDVNLFIDHSQIVQLEALRAGIWGTKSTWGRIVSFPSEVRVMSKQPTYCRSFKVPDEVRQFKSHGHLDVLNFSNGTTIGRGVFQPGWKWSNDVKPLAETSSCEASHHGYCLSGSMVVRMDSGEEFKIQPGDVFSIPSGHDAWVDSSTECVLIDVGGFKEYAKKAVDKKAAA